MNKYLIIAALGIFFIPSLTNAFFDNDLSYGSQGEEVVELQEFLIDQGCLTNGSATGRFFSLTRTAVKCFQTKSGVNATGYFGPVTRTKASELLAMGASVEEEAAINETGDIPKPADKNPILMIQQQLESLWAQLEKVNNEAKTQTFLQQRMLEVRENSAPTPSPSVTPTPTPEPTPFVINDAGISAWRNGDVVNSQFVLSSNKKIDLSKVFLLPERGQPIKITSQGALDSFGEQRYENGAWKVSIKSNVEFFTLTKEQHKSQRGASNYPYYIKYKIRVSSIDGDVVDLAEKTFVLPKMESLDPSFTITSANNVGKVAKLQVSALGQTLNDVKIAGVTVSYRLPQSEFIATDRFVISGVNENGTLQSNGTAYLDIPSLTGEATVKITAVTLADTNSISKTFTLPTPAIIELSQR